MVTATGFGKKIELRDDVWVFSDTGEPADPVTLMEISIKDQIDAAEELRRNAKNPKDGRAYSLAIAHLEDALFRVGTITRG